MLRMISCCVALVFFSLAAHAQGQRGRWEVNVRGISMGCNTFNGEPVAIFLDERLNNVGVAHRMTNGQPVIVINPRVTRQHSDIVAAWWFMHECAHHALPPAYNSEVNADCYGVRQMVQMGLISHPRQLEAFVYELSHLPGSPMGHLPGPVRAQNIINCALG